MTTTSQGPSVVEVPFTRTMTRKLDHHTGAHLAAAHRTAVPRVSIYEGLTKRESGTQLELYHKHGRVNCKNARITVNMRFI